MSAHTQCTRSAISVKQAALDGVWMAARTSHPARYSACVTAKPIPPAAPVTIAVFPMPVTPYYYTDASCLFCTTLRYIGR